MYIANVYIFKRNKIALLFWLNELSSSNLEIDIQVRGVKLGVFFAIFHCRHMHNTLTSGLSFTYFKKKSIKYISTPAKTNIVKESKQKLKLIINIKYIMLVLLKL